MLTKPIIVYHTKTQSTICPDGFCAAMLYWRVYGNEADYVPIMYHQSLPIEMFAGRDVVFVDFSFNVDTMDAINEVANSLIMFDHHMPKAPTFEGREYAHFGKAECASVMVYRHLYQEQDKPMPIMIELIDDADRNLNMHEDVLPFVIALSTEPSTFERWSKLMVDLESPGLYSEFLVRGRLLQSYEDAKIELLVKDSFPLKLCGIDGLAVNSNKFFAHRVATKLSEYSKTFGAVFYLRADGNVEVSLRRLDPDIDVEKIASSFSGGGHPGAASFSVSMARFEELMFPSRASNTFYIKLEAAVRNFQHVLSHASRDDLEETFYEHLIRELGSYVADDLHFTVTESVGHPPTFTRLRSAFAMALGMPKVVCNSRWYHHLFPYVTKPEFTFDEERIKEVLLARRTGDKSGDQGLVQKLMDTVNVSNKSELVTSVYYVHVSVKDPVSCQTIRHTFEILK